MKVTVIAIIIGAISKEMLRSLKELEIEPRPSKQRTQ